MKLKYLFSSGKNSNIAYYIKHYSKVYLPKAFFQKRLKKKLANIEKRKDVNYIKDRIDYYNKLVTVSPLPETSKRLRDLKKGNGVKTVYFLDAYDIISWFDDNYRWNYVPRDVTHVPEVPSILKSRPINGDNANSVVLKIEKVRHFTFLDDKIPFSEKKNKLIFRGQVDRKPHRIAFMEMYFGHPLCDLGNVTNSKDLHKEWKVEKLTLYEHLDYKFILAMEGNDVASNLKWVMSSNSIAVMPEPKYETWFMEGKLIPDFHYIRIKDDYSDLEKRLTFYMENLEEAQKIIDNAHRYVSQFFDEKREHLIGLAVMDKYLRKTGQK